MLLFISARGSDAIAARLPPSSRAGRRGDKEKMCFSAIETLSREISRHSAARTIEDCDFSTAVEMTIRAGGTGTIGGLRFLHSTADRRNDDRAPVSFKECDSRQTFSYAYGRLINIFFLQINQQTLSINMRIIIIKYEYRICYFLIKVI